MFSNLRVIPHQFGIRASCGLGCAPFFELDGVEFFAIEENDGDPGQVQVLFPFFLIFSHFFIFLLFFFSLPPLVGSPRGGGGGAAPPPPPP